MPATLQPWMARWRQIRKSFAFHFGVLAVAFAVRAESILTSGTGPPGGGAIETATALFGVAIALLLVGWSGTYRNSSLLLTGLLAAGPRAALRVLSTRRGQTLILALALNVAGILLLRNDWSSLPGGALWLASLALLVVACLGERGSPAPSTAAEADEGSSWRLPRLVELGALLAIITLAVTMRLWRLGDLTPGMHGDEGEAGTEALKIASGHLVSPFTPGWFNQPNMYYWSIALGMRVFGTGLFGLRVFSVLCGLVTVLFVYLLARELFGQRAALIAGFLVAFQSAAILFSREEFSNATTPALMAVAAYFLVRGLRTGRHLHFVLAGFASGFSLYYYAGGRLAGPILLALLVFLAVRHRSFLRTYWTRAGAFAAALYAISAPFALYFLIEHPTPVGYYPNDRYIWLHRDALAGLYGASDWPTIIWNQLTRTLSIVTYRSDASALGALNYPIARPLEAALIVLGIAWSAWRWRDTRFALISLWFWATVLLGGVLTIDAPNLPRLVGLLPVLPLAIAAVLDHLIDRFSAALGDLGTRPVWSAAGQWLGGAGAAALLGLVGTQNWQMYIDSYLQTHQNPNVTGQAAYVQQKGLGYRYYDLGAGLLYWTHGDNRFINPHADGIDVANPPDYLPMIDNGLYGEKDVVFLIWPMMRDYLQALQTYYPEGREEVVPLGDSQHPIDPLITYTITHQQIDRHRVLQARYAAADGRVVERSEAGFGLPSPAHLAYPLQARWEGGLVAPAYDSYRFRLAAPPGSRLTVDGLTAVMVRDAGRSPATGRLVLARGLHTVRLVATLQSPQSRVNLQWSASAGRMEPIASRFLWDDHVQGAWLAEVQITDQVSPLSTPDTGSSNGTASVLSRRLDGFLGFRDTRSALDPYGLPYPLVARWSSLLRVPRAGWYSFELESFGESVLRVDGQVVVNNIQGSAQDQSSDGTIHLSPGDHQVEIGYVWRGNVGRLDCWWTPPGQGRELFITPALHAPGPAAWRPGSVSPPVQPPPTRPTVPLGATIPQVPGV